MSTTEAQQWRTVTKAVLELPGLGATHYQVNSGRITAECLMKNSLESWRNKRRCNCQTRLTTLLMNRSFCGNVYVLKRNMRLSSHFATRLFNTPILKQFNINASNTSFRLSQHLISTMTVFIPSEGSMAPPFSLDAQNIFLLLSLLLLNVPSWYVDWPYWSFPKDSSTRYVSVAHW